MSTENSAGHERSACDGKHSTTSIYLAGEGREWKDDLQNDESFAKANVEFVKSHSGLDETVSESAVDSEKFVIDRSLLDGTDGTFLKYEHGMERHDALTDDGPIAVWWDEYTHATSTVDGGYFSLEDAPSWVYDSACSIGVYEDRSVALTSLLSETGHGADNPYPCEVDGDTTDSAVLLENKPLVPTLAVFASHGLGETIPRAWFNEAIPNYDKGAIDTVLSFLDTLGVLDYSADANEVSMIDDSRSRELLEDFVSWYNSPPTTV